MSLDIDATFTHRDHKREMWVAKKTVKGKLIFKKYFKDIEVAALELENVTKKLNEPTG